LGENADGAAISLIKAEEYKSTKLKAEKEKYALSN
jgi:hypothetical protein